MTGKKVGYKRVSTYEQNPDSQLGSVELDKVFVDIESGFSTKNRAQLAALQDYVREDDIVYVECMDRLGRNSYDLDEIVEFLLAKGVQIIFVREGITLGKKNDLMSKLAYDMMKCFIHFFSALAKERQKIGIEKAKKDGKYEKRKKRLDPFQVETIRHDLKIRKTKAQIARDLGICRFTLYRYIHMIEEEEAKRDHDAFVNENIARVAARANEPG